MRSDTSLLQSATAGSATGAAAAARKRRTRGSAIVEISLLAPWIFFLFVGTLDMGFFGYSLIAVENAARVAAEYTSKSSTVAADSSEACTLALNELRMLPNVGSGTTTCSGAPVTVSASSVSGTDGSPATSVSVTYNSASLVPIPGLLMGKLNVTRIVQMRVKP
jgi:Flp pilus assembly protein TadG